MYRVCPMTRSDFPEVMRIERAAFEFPWTEQEFTDCFLGGCERMVARYRNGKAGEVLGFAIYEIYQTGIHVLSFAVDPNMQRKGVGSAMMHALKRKLSRKKWAEIHLEVREGNLGAQQFYREHEFRAISVLRGHYPKTPEDAYLMQYRHVKTSRKQETVLS